MAKRNGASVGSTQRPLDLSDVARQIGCGVQIDGVIVGFRLVFGGWPAEAVSRSVKDLFRAVGPIPKFLGAFDSVIR